MFATVSDNSARYQESKDYSNLSNLKINFVNDQQSIGKFVNTLL